MKKNKGFTLVELLVVIAILAVMATVSIVGYSKFINKAYAVKDLVLVKEVNRIIFQIKIDGKEVDMDMIDRYAKENGASISSYKSNTDESIVVFDKSQHQLVQCRFTNGEFEPLNDDNLSSNKKDIVVVIHNYKDLEKFTGYDFFIADDYTGDNTVSNETELNSKIENYDVLVVVADFEVEGTTNVNKDVTIYGLGHLISKETGKENFSVKENKTLELHNVCLTNNASHCFDNSGRISIYNGAYVAEQCVFNNNTNALVVIYNGSFESNTAKVKDNINQWLIKNNKGSMTAYNGTFKVNCAPFEKGEVQQFFWPNSGLNPSELKPADKEITITFNGDTAVVK